MAAQYTPGPWLYRPDKLDDWGVVRSGRNWICQAKDPRFNSDKILAEHRVAKTDPWEANARLIAAAPDLLAIAERFVSALEGDNVDYDELAGGARAAIAKARGEA